ncbi:relaxase/mobilization nuclease domain-containing protein [Rhizobium sp.]|uniref:relaxase/mobilization nuclease domain-containing protein n=1 Tax=Rhizobium sp. TaxID=391 RepID=UPI00289E9B86
MELFFGAFTTEWEQRRAAMLQDKASGRGALDELEKRLKRAEQLGGSGGGGGQGRPFRLGIGRGLKSASAAMALPGGSGRSMEARLTDVAKGSQPAVVKMASYGGGARLGAMLNYVSRSGEVKVETENGEILRGRDELSRVREDWDHLFQNRTESRDIGGFVVEIQAGSSGHDGHERIREILNSGFDDRRYAYAIEARPDGSAQISGLVVLRSGKGERLTADAKASEIVQSRYGASMVGGETSATFTFTGHGNGVEYGASRLRDLVEDRSDVRDEKGRVISTEAEAGDLVQKEWRREMHSRKGRDLMHVIMSARAGTNATQFEGAVREFLAQQFASHRYVFAMHDPEHDPKEAADGGRRPHVHAHAIVTMRSEAGDRIETTPAVFRQWRVVMAEKAREHGIAMEMTDRREFATAPAFTRNQVRAVSLGGRTEHVGTSAPAQARYSAKRRERRTVASSERSLAYTKMAQGAWEKIVSLGAEKNVTAFAEARLSALSEGISEPLASEKSEEGRPDFTSIFRTNMMSLQNTLLEGQDLREQSRSEFEAYEKSVESALFKLEQSADAGEKTGLDEVARAARDIVNIRRELLEIHERDSNRKASDRAVSGEADQPRDDANARWDAAVERHGEAVVDAGNEAMLTIEHYREALDRIEAGTFSNDSEAQYRAGLTRALEDAAKLAAQGNTYLREVAEEDQDLKAAIAGDETAAQRPNQKDESKQSSSVDADRVDEQERIAEEGREELSADEASERDIHDLAATVDATNRQLDRVNRERDAAQTSGETTRSDPAQQHIPRLEELEREQEEEKERDRDDRER